MGLFAGLVALVALSVPAVFGPPMCTGPAVTRCDYISVAKSEAIARHRDPFDPAYGIDVFDIGSSVRVQQRHIYAGLIETTAVVIDEHSCRPCSVESYRDPTDPDRGRLLMAAPPEDPAAASENARRMREAGIQPW